jgi:hypothetical protein
MTKIASNPKLDSILEIVKRTKNDLRKGEQLIIRAAVGMVGWELWFRG